MLGRAEPVEREPDVGAVRGVQGRVGRQQEGVHAVQQPAWGQPDGAERRVDRRVPQPVAPERPERVEERGRRAPSTDRLAHRAEHGAVDDDRVGGVRAEERAHLTGDRAPQGHSAEGRRMPRRPRRPCDVEPGEGADRHGADRVRPVVAAAGAQPGDRDPVPPCREFAGDRDRRRDVPADVRADEEHVERSHRDLPVRSPVTCPSDVDAGAAGISMLVCDRWRQRDGSARKRPGRGGPTDSGADRWRRCRSVQHSPNPRGGFGLVRQVVTDRCAPGRNRTCDRQIRRLLLYPLSYGGRFAKLTGLQGLSLRWAPRCRRRRVSRRHPEHVS